MKRRPKLAIPRCRKCSRIHGADLYCGGGGTSKGAARAFEQLGVPLDVVDWAAINHWQTALNTHSENHPWARHILSPVEALHPPKVFPCGRLNLLIAAPECTFHSVARGGRPINDQKRASAFTILEWTSELYVDAVLIENVPEFRNWGPLGADGRPLKSGKAKIFQQFINTLKAQGYSVAYDVLNAADYGSPTSRRRLFIIARRDRAMVRWPSPTHSKGGRIPGTKPWRAAREIIDWSFPSRSIWEPGRRPLAENTMRRIWYGLWKYGGDELKPFLVVMRGGTDAQLQASAHSLDEPVPGLSAEGTHVGLAEPETYLLSQHGGATLRPDRLPAPTIAAGGAIAKVDVFLLGQHGNAALRPVSEPAPTIAAAGKIAKVDATLIQTSYGGRVVDPGDPLPTITTARGGDMGVGDAFIMATGGPAGQMQPHSVDDLLGTVHPNHRLNVFEGVIVPPLGVHARDGKANLPYPATEPLKTVLAERGAGHLVTAHIQTHFGERDGQAPRVHSIEDPLPALTSREPALVEGVLVNYHGQSLAHPITGPVPTFGTKDQVALVEPRWVQPEIGGRRLDIRFRMLQPKELAAAMGFAPDYAFTGKREDVVRQIGNAVPVDVAAALCRELLIGGRR